MDLLLRKRLLKGGGLEHVVDSIVTDNGSQITVAGTVSASSYTSSIVLPKFGLITLPLN